MTHSTSDNDPRREAILKAAADLFFERGYAETSIDAIIERVGGSKRTLYRLFGNKPGLFEAIIRENGKSLFAETTDAAPGPLPFETALEQFATRLLELTVQPRTVAIYRVVVSEAPRFPDLGRIFFEHGPLRGKEWLIQTLARAASEGIVTLPDPEAAAGIFMGMVRNDLQQQMILGLRQTPSSAEIRQIARAATTVFLDGIRN
ncbi:TetR/AcrR family transcriptional regulator [Paracoccus seriniphilus]|uniref:Transcriptional regulator, TetR family n=1 Tax=Paracoccus seriniphilus TaxID=184748 RepID=A0A239PXR5_9RHOB|nr:TetR/AcrR family transcriptional regulator [Paracoccus seriniphilus]WCR14147.1 TetR/AcrR family transcriptional regulator [Paracoccus seriniphilus]SNT75055.1 transcriptional regulator, TetR family [Paracoccus seriniphilus]